MNVVGKTRPSRLPQLHHTKQYEQDFPLIGQVVELFPTIFTTPNVLTEVSNLGKRLGDEFFVTFGKVITVLEERYYASKDACAATDFRRLGLTEADLCTIATKHLVITLDVDLYLNLRVNKVDAVNFNHLRPLAWAGLIPSLR